MSGFTPGPWGYQIDAEQSVTVLAREPSGGCREYVAQMSYAADDTVEANARLIAAAPELLDAAERGLEWAIDAANECSLPKDEAVFENAMRDVRRIEAALAKARGEQA